MKNLFLAALLSIAGCATGSHVITGTIHPATLPEGVKIYSTAPANSEVIGIVSASSISGLTWQQASDDALRRLKIEASKIGANGIVVKNSENDFNSGSKVSGTAIYVTP
jgi:hypothetical protein